MSQAGTYKQGSGTGYPIESITGNTGTKVLADGTNNVNILGGTGITTSGSGSTLTITATGTTNLTYTNVSSSPYVVLNSDEYLSVDCSGGAITLEFPNSTAVGRTYIVKDRTGNANIHTITVTTVGGTDKFDAATTYSMNTQYAAIDVIFNGTNWEIF